MNKPNRLQAALERGLALGGNLHNELAELGEYEIASVGDAEILTHTLAEFVTRPIVNEAPFSAFWELIHLFQMVTSAEAYRYLAINGLPHLIECYDERLKDAANHVEDLQFAQKIFARYGIEEGLDRVVDAAFHPTLNEGHLWSVVFEQLGDSDPLIPSLIKRLTDPLPDGFACVALLDWINRLVREDVISSHPFQSPSGIERLRKWLRDGREEYYSYAHSAAAALPFIPDPPRTELLALAMDHPDIGVQMEAAWASARLGSDAGAKFLSRLCLDRNLTVRARKYLTELGREQDIPDEANTPEFVALSEMCAWLDHPQEFGRPPDEIELYDFREMFWPPTNDWRTLWIFSYRYHSTHDTQKEDASAYDEGVGMIGSIAFSLIGETSVTMPPEDIYALHCCWELEVTDDPRAPAERSIEAGRALIDAAQDDDLEDDEKF